VALAFAPLAVLLNIISAYDEGFDGVFCPVVVDT
jgi:hypothetical protein